MTTGYPVGTVCVITWPINESVFGKTVTVGETKRTETLHNFFEFVPPGLAHRITDWDGIHGKNWYWPVAWLRPLRDPDAELEPVKVMEETA